MTRGKFPDSKTLWARSYKKASYEASTSPKAALAKHKHEKEHEEEEMTLSAYLGLEESDVAVESSYSTRIKEEESFTLLTACRGTDCHGRREAARPSYDQPLTLMRAILSTLQPLCRGDQIKYHNRNDSDRNGS